VHHLVADQVSMRIMLEDLETAVVQRTGGEELRFLPKTTSWLSWGRRLSTYGASDEVQSQRTYWTELVNVPAGRLPDDLPVEAGQDTEASTRTVAATLDAGQTTELLKAGDTVQDLLLTALARTLGEWTGAARHLVDLERHDRQPIFDDVDLTRTIGWFSHTHPVALPGGSAAAPQETLRQVGESLRAVPSAGTGWQLLRQHRDPVPPAPADLLFTYTGAELRPVTGAFALAGTVGGDRSPAAPRPYGLEVSAGVAGGELTVRWAYSEQRHHRATIDRLAARYAEHLRTLIAPADGEQNFPLARVDQADIDTLLGRLTSGQESR
jgi:non-ribosomal peptide synthase protein (TIGR01720 family)